MIPRFKFEINDNFIQEVNAVLHKGELAYGENIELFENELSKVLGYSHIISCINGFAALHMSIEAAIGRNKKKVLIPACSSCFTVVNAVLTSGNIPEFYDINLENLGYNINSISEKIDNSTCAIIIVHHFGIIAPLNPLKKITNLPIIEDFAQSIFSKHLDRHNLSGDIGIFSFYPTKGIVGIDGGAVACRDTNLYNKIVDIRYYKHQKKYDNLPRYNYKLNNVNATLAYLYSKNIKTLIKEKLKIQKVYDKVLSDYQDIVKLYSDNRNKTIFQKYVICMRNKEEADFFCEKMFLQDIEISRELFLLVHQNNFPKAQIAQNCILSIPFYESLTKNEIKIICLTMKNVLKKIRK